MLHVGTMVRSPRIEELAQWVAYCRLQGAQRVIVYDHRHPAGPSPNLQAMRAALAVWMDEGAVELRTEVAAQSASRARRWGDVRDTSTTRLFSALAASDDCFQRARGEADWLAWLDIDEFMLPLQHPGIPAALASLADADTAAVLVEMRRYGDSGHINRPDGLLLECYDIRERDFALSHAPQGDERDRLYRLGNYRKSVVSPTRVGAPVQAQHRWQSRPGFRDVDAPADVLRLEHYFTRSMEDYVDKYMLGGPFGHSPHQSWARFRFLAQGARPETSLAGIPLVRDRHMQRYAAAVRAELERVGVPVPPPRTEDDQCRCD